MFMSENNLKTNKMSNLTQDPKQLMIVRQSSLKFMESYLRTIGTPCTLREVLRMNENICKYVIEGPTDEVMEKIQAMDKHLMGKYEE